MPAFGLRDHCHAPSARFNSAGTRRVGGARPLQIALHLVFGIVRARSQQTLRDRSCHRRVRAGAQRAALAHRRNQRAGVELALRNQLAQRVAEREPDERAFVARRHVQPGADARLRLAPAQHEVDLLGSFRNRRPAARARTLLPQHLQPLVSLVVRQAAAHEMATHGRSGAADAGAAVQVNALAGGELAVDQVEDSRHVRRGVGQAVIEDRQAPIVHAALRQLGQQGVVLRQLALLGEIDEAGDARGQQPLHALHGVGARHRAGIFAGEEPARLHPIAVRNRGGEVLGHRPGMIRKAGSGSSADRKVPASAGGRHPVGCAPQRGSQLHKKRTFRTIR